MSTRKPITRTAKVRRYFASEAGQKLNHVAPAAAVFAVAAYQSYWHTVEVALRADSSGAHPETAYILPISVDGLMIVSARYVTHAKTKLGKGIAFLFFVLGVAATLGSNVAAADPNTLARVVAVWPAIALVGTAAVLHWGERKAKARRPARRATAAKAETEAKGLHAVA